MGKGQKKSIFRIRAFQGLTLLFILLLAGYNNCSDININGQRNTSSLPETHQSPPVDPKADTVTYDPSRTSPATCDVNAVMYGDVTTLYPTNISRKATYQGVEYPMRIVDNGLVNCDMVYHLDPIDRAVAIRNIKFQGFYSFRIRTPKGINVLNQQYHYQNLSSPIEKTYLISISKYPGDIDPARSSSMTYCNLKRSDDIYVADGAKVEPPCRVYEDAIYYINVFYPDKPYPVPSGESVHFVPENNMEWNTLLIPVDCSTINFYNQGYCKYF